MFHPISMRRWSVFTIVIVLAGLSAEAVRAQPYTLTTGPVGTGSGNVIVGVDGFGAFGNCSTAGVNDLSANSTEAFYDPVAAPGNIASTYGSGVALRIGAVGPRAFLTAGTIRGTGGLANPVVTGTTTTGNSTFTDPSGNLSFSLVQTVAPSFNGAARTGSLLTQTYTVTNTTAAPITFELVRFLNSSGVSFGGGLFFAADGKEVSWADAPVPCVMGITAIGGTPLSQGRYEIKAFPIVETDIVAGLAMNDAIAPGLPYDVQQAFVNVFTLAAGASTVFTTHTIWGNGPAPTVMFPNAPPPVVPAPGVLYGISTSVSQLFAITTTPTAGIGAGLPVGPLTAPMQSPGLSFRSGKLYAWDQVNTRLQQIDPASAATLATIDIGVAPPGLGGDMAFRSDGLGFLSQGGNFWRFDVTIPNSTALPVISVPISGLAFNAADNLIGLRPNGSQFYTIDQATGVATPFLGPTGVAGGIGGACAYDGSGNLYAAVIDPSLATFLYKIDLATGTATLLGNLGVDQLTGLSFYRATAPPTGGGGAGGIGEGSYAGSLGPAIAVNRPVGEGTFGFGARKTARPPILIGPSRDGLNAMKWRVFNISYRQTPSPDAPGEPSGTSGLGWALLPAIGLALLAIVGAKYRPNAS